MTSTIEERLQAARAKVEETKIDKARAEERVTALTERLHEVRDRMQEAGVSSVSEATARAEELRQQASAALDRAEAALQETT